MKKLITSAGLAAIAAALLLPTMASAQAAAPASSLSFNVGVVSDYRYRGISQTRLKPALQGGVDYTAGSFYVGAWASTIKWIKDNAGVSGGSVKGPIELDLYGGYKGALTEAVGFDVGVLSYQYLGNKLADTADSNGVPGNVWSNANTTEVYGALTAGPATVKLSYALTDLFGNKNSDGSYYLEGGAGFDVGAGFTLTPHIGYQKVRNTSVATYTDYSLALSKEVVTGLTASLTAYSTDADKVFYSPGGAYKGSYKYLGRSGFVLGLKYAF